LDIDHVINALHFGSDDIHPDWGKKDFNKSEGEGGFHVVWSEKVTEQLSVWKQTERIDIRWLTSWGLSANKFFD
jgi:hypothetical protein